LRHYSDRLGSQGGQGYHLDKMETRRGSAETRVSRPGKRLSLGEAVCTIAKANFAHLSQRIAATVVPERRSLIYRLASQAVCAWRQGSSERSMALSVTMSLRMTAVITALAHFPFRLSRSAKLFMMGLCRAAVSAAM